MSDFQIRAISATRTRPLRASVLRPHQQAHTLIYEGDDDADTLHAGAFIDGELCGIATLVHCSLADPAGPGDWLLRGMATLPQVRGQGVGKALLDYVIRYARDRRAAAIWCNARENALAFYQTAGFEILSEAFEVPAIGPHRVMRLSLEASATADAASQPV